MKRLAPSIPPANPPPPENGTKKPLVQEGLVFKDRVGKDAAIAPTAGNKTPPKINGSQHAQHVPKKPPRTSGAQVMEVSPPSMQAGHYGEVSRKVKQWRIAVGSPEGGNADDESNNYARDAVIQEMQDQIEELQSLVRNHDSKTASYRKQVDERFDMLDDKMEFLKEQMYRLETLQQESKPNAIALSRVDLEFGDSNGNSETFTRDLMIRDDKVPAKKIKKKEVDPMEAMKLEPVNHEIYSSGSEDSTREKSKKVVEQENYEIRQENRQREQYNPPSGDDDPDWDDWLWKSNAENAFGAFIQSAMQEGLVTAFKQCGVMVILSWLVQFTITKELLGALPPVKDAPGHCDNPSTLQIASVGVWFLLMLNNVSGMLTAGLISLCATETRTEEVDEATGETHKVINDASRSFSARLVIFIFAALSEMGMWGFVLYTGILFILTADDAVLIVRSTVAITFVQNIDEFIYQSCATDNIKECVNATKYRIKYNKLWCGIDLKTIFEVEKFYSLYLHCPLLLALALITVGLARGLEDVECVDLF